MEIYIDNREDNERIDMLLEDNFFSEAIVTQLSSGDIVVKQNDRNIAIEVKTMQDWIRSCKDRQVQKEALQMSSFPFRCVVIYDDGKWNKFFVKNISYAQHYGNIASLTLRYKSPVFVCESKKSFIECVKAIIRSVEKIDEPIEPPIMTPSQSNDFMRVVMGIKNGVGKKMARTLLDKFKTPGGVFKASDDELDEVPRLSKKSKNAIRRMR